MWFSQLKKIKKYKCFYLIYEENNSNNKLQCLLKKLTFQGFSLQTKYFELNNIEIKIFSFCFFNLNNMLKFG
jgi:hypothetical protein